MCVRRPTYRWTRDISTGFLPRRMVVSASMASHLASGTEMRRVSASALKPSWMTASAICNFAALTAKPRSRKVPTAILAWMA